MRGLETDEVVWLQGQGQAWSCESDSWYKKPRKTIGTTACLPCSDLYHSFVLKIRICWLALMHLNAFHFAVGISLIFYT